MVALGLMIEGQDGLNWPRWQRLLEAAQDLGFTHVFRSDHFSNPAPPDLDSLEMWTSLTYAASATERIEFGPLVAPVTFRHPAMTARVAAAVDDLSGGRLTLGIGAGWNVREHRQFGIPFPSTDVRYRMLREQLEVVSLLLHSDEPVTYHGECYQLEEAVLLPRPARAGGPPILVGGNGPRRTLLLAAEFADEWNAVFVSVQGYGRLQAQFDALLAERGRDRSSVRRSVMCGTLLAHDDASLRNRLHDKGNSLEDLTGQGYVAGTPDMWIEQLRGYADAGAERVMLQWLEQDNIEGLEIIAREVLPAFQT